MVVVRRVGVLSAFKVAFLVNGLISLVFGALFMMPFFLLGGLTFLDNSSGAQLFGVVGLATACFMYLAVGVLGAFAGGVSAAIFAAVYNLISGWIGGLEVELTEVREGEVRKREE